MQSKPVALLLADLGVTKTHSRPHVSNDNPYSESQFKTLKYCPQFPQRFGSIEDAHLFCRNFFGYYNHEHLCLLFIHPPAHGSEVSPAARNTLDSARIPRASKLLICGLFQKVRVLAQDGVESPAMGKVRAIPKVGGLHHYYTRHAAA